MWRCVGAATVTSCVTCWFPLAGARERGRSAVGVGQGSDEPHNASSTERDLDAGESVDGHERRSAGERHARRRALRPRT